MTDFNFNVRKFIGRPTLNAHGGDRWLFVVVLCTGLIICEQNIFIKESSKSCRNVIEALMVEVELAMLAGLWKIKVLAQNLEFR